MIEIEVRSDHKPFIPETLWLRVSSREEAQQLKAIFQNALKYSKNRTASGGVSNLELIPICEEILEELSKVR